jgi:Bromodomain
MDLETMHTNVDAGAYETLDAFLAHLRLIHDNARAFNPCDARDARGRAIVHSAAAMRDAALSHAHNFKRHVGYDLFAR